MTKVRLIIVAIADHGGFADSDREHLRDAAVRTRSGKHFAVGSVTAIKAYHQEYGRFPDIGVPLDSSRDVIAGEPEAGAVAPNEALFDVLRAIDRGTNAGHSQNPKKIVFFESRVFDDAPEGKPPGRACDQWGTQFNVIMDTNGDGRLDVGGCYSDFADEGRPRVSVGVFSFGQDGLPGTKGNRIYHDSDDIVSWQ